MKYLSRPVIFSHDPYTSSQYLFHQDHLPNSGFFSPNHNYFTFYVHDRDYSRGEVLHFLNGSPLMHTALSEGDAHYSYGAMLEAYGKYSAALAVVGAVAGVVLATAASTKVKKSSSIRHKSYSNKYSHKSYSHQEPTPPNFHFKVTDKFIDDSYSGAELTKFLNLWHRQKYITDYSSYYKIAQSFFNHEFAYDWVPTTNSTFASNPDRYPAMLLLDEKYVQLGSPSLVSYLESASESFRYNIIQFSVQNKTFTSQEVGALLSDHYFKQTILHENLSIFGVAIEYIGLPFSAIASFVRFMIMGPVQQYSAEDIGLDEVYTAEEVTEFMNKYYQRAFRTDKYVYELIDNFLTHKYKDYKVPTSCDGKLHISSAVLECSKEQKDSYDESKAQMPKEKPLTEVSSSTQKEEDKCLVDSHEIVQDYINEISGGASHIFSDFSEWITK
ncbi:MAG: hypothetical protein SFT91_00715 [Rickettsiaceae bacterium]|nr:hypothetical protein [Rickettsiaceae bacterium]